MTMFEHEAARLVGERQMSTNIRNAVWSSRTHDGEPGRCWYKVRNRGAKSWYSETGNIWTDSYGNAIPRAELGNSAIRLHGGPSDGVVVNP